MLTLRPHHTIIQLVGIILILLILALNTTIVPLITIIPLITIEPNKEKSITHYHNNPNSMEIILTNPIIIEQITPHQVIPIVPLKMTMEIQDLTIQSILLLVLLNIIMISMINLWDII